MLSNVDPNLRELREQNRRNTETMYSVCTPYKQGKFDEDRPIQAHDTPFMVMVTRAAHSRGERLTNADATDASTSPSAAGAIVLPGAKISAISIYQDLAEHELSDESKEPDLGEENTLTNARVSQNAPASREQKPDNTNDAPPSNSSTRALSFDSAALPADTDALNMPPPSTGTSNESLSDSSTQSAASSSAKGVALEIARKVKAAMLSDASATVEALAALITPTVSRFEDSLSKEATDSAAGTKEPSAADAAGAAQDPTSTEGEPPLALKSRNMRSASCGARIVTPTTAFDYLRRMNSEPCKNPVAHHQRQTAPPQRSAPWRGSMAELRRQQQVVAPKPKPVRRSMTTANAVDLLTRGHWFLKKLGNRRNYKPQPRFVWLHQDSSSGKPVRLLCWDKRGRQDVPARSQTVELSSLRRTIWRSGSHTSLDFVDRNGGDRSKRTLNVKGVGGMSGSDEAIMRWSEALVKIGFTVKDRGVNKARSLR